MAREMTTEEAIKILKWIAEIYDSKNTVYENQALTMAIQALRAQQAGGWISVKDRLPEEPEEALTAKEMAEVACALDLLKEYQSVGSIEHFRELSQAEHDGLLVVKPCKVGDTLYSITCGEIKPFVVAGFEMYDKDLIAVEQIKLGRELRVVGKTAFLTREEAEAALVEKGGA